LLSCHNTDVYNKRELDPVVTGFLAVLSPATAVSQECEGMWSRGAPGSLSYLVVIYSL